MKQKKNNISVVLCAIAKCENNYIREWVEHHLNIGFDKIIICDNNDVDGEHIEDVIQDYINNDRVNIVDFRGKSYRNKDKNNPLSIQTECYNYCYYNYKYDWYFFEDIDEYLTLEHHNNVKDFLRQSKFNDFDNIKLCWKYYDDNNLSTVENNNYSIKRFTKHSDSESQNMFVKSFIRGGMEIIINSAHGFGNDGNNRDVRSCNALGEKDILEQVLKDNNIIHKEAWVNHYRFKTIEEYINIKRRRGWPDNYANFVKMDLKLFFSYNKITLKKIYFILYTCIKHLIRK